MAEFLTTHGTAFQIENVIAGARATLTLVSPFLKLSKTLTERLQDAARRGVTITIVFGKEELEREQEDILSGLAGARLYFLPNLHAKCYFNEDRMVITSMNMYEFSEKHNREMGILLEAGEAAYKTALREVDSIIAASEARSVGPTDPASRKTRRSTENFPARASSRVHRDAAAVCIRCQASVPRDPWRPLCIVCYGVWSTYKNADYPEQWCHFCGRREETSVNRPLCRSCYRSVSNAETP
jgi:PLD-like domain